jgi:hypothetical protein
MNRLYLFRVYLAVYFIALSFVSLAQNSQQQVQVDGGGYTAVFLSNSNAIEIQTQPVNDFDDDEQVAEEVADPKAYPIVSSTNTRPDAPRTGLTQNKTTEKVKVGFLKAAQRDLRTKIRKLFYRSNKKDRCRNNCFLW